MEPVVYPCAKHKAQRPPSRRPRLKVLLGAVVPILALVLAGCPAKKKPAPGAALYAPAGTVAELAADCRLTPDGKAFAEPCRFRVTVTQTKVITK